MKWCAIARERPARIAFNELGVAMGRIGFAVALALLSVGCSGHPAARGLDGSVSLDATPAGLDARTSAADAATGTDAATATTVDAGSMDAAAPADGSTPRCGDGETDFASGESCDDGNAVTEVCSYGEVACTVCDADCKEVAGATSYCGDGPCASPREDAVSCPADCSCAPGTCTELRLPTWPLRPFDVCVPPGYPGTGPLPVVLAIHGGGGNKLAQLKQTCPVRDDPAHPECLHRVGDCQGFMVVYTNGTLDSVLGDRTYNATKLVAGQDLGSWACVSGPACANAVSEAAFFSDLLDYLESNYAVDTDRVFATGLSNGAAMSHRLACELSGRIAAVAPIAGGNQFAAVNGCSPLRPVSVLQLHGTEDSCWPLAGGSETCVGLQPAGDRISIPATMVGWAARNGCQPTAALTAWPERVPDDGTSVVEHRYEGCGDGAEVVLLEIVGGGHTWPGGSDGLAVSMVGVVSRELSANRVMWEFFRRHPRR